MNRTDRLLAIILELQGRGKRRAEDLAETFETSKRTIYRDIQALCETGVPIVSIPGRGYSLIEGYFLPPLSFTADEATMLLLGSDVMTQTFDTQYRAAAESAGRKIASVLPERLRAEVHELQEAIHFIVPSKPGPLDEAGMLQLLRRAIIERRGLRFRYFARHRSIETDQTDTREVDPYSLAHVAGIWYLTAYDHLRHAVRTFRLGRIEGPALLERTFTRPAGFRLRVRNTEVEGAHVIRALFDAESVRWVRESPSFFQVAAEQTPDGLLVTLRAREENDVVQWLLGWGRHVRVLEPESLRLRLVAEGEALTRNHRGR
ncbi:MAG TPA: YafY family protein [Ktedonobacterales bacterium]|nr:YafY family protein [Ktedonobacterales bacterium]